MIQCSLRKYVIITSKEISLITTSFGKKPYFLSVENELSCFFWKNQQGAYQLSQSPSLVFSRNPTHPMKRCCVYHWLCCLCLTHLLHRDLLLIFWTGLFCILLYCLQVMNCENHSITNRLIVYYLTINITRRKL